eukprot:jgi/Botrbrau1/2148/Bobra.0093s0053.1
MLSFQMQRGAPLIQRHSSLSQSQGDWESTSGPALRRKLSVKRDAVQAPHRARLLYLVLATFLVCVFLISLSRHRPGVGFTNQPPDKHHQGGEGIVEVGIVSPLYLGEVYTNPKHRAASSLPETDATPLSSSSLLLASHTRVLWHDVETGANRVIHEGEGVYHGVFPGPQVDGRGQPTSLWLLSRPQDWQPGSAEEFLIQIDSHSGMTISRVRLLSRFAHDAVRRGDQVYISSTADGEIFQLSMPGMGEVARFELFTPHQHVNSLAPLTEGRMWALLHNMGNSELVLLDSKEGRIMERHKGVATKGHNLVAWRSWLLLLDSGNGGLARFQPQTAKRDNLWHAPEPGMYTKGLAVIDDIAYFGLSPAQPKEGRADTSLDCELVAYDLIEGRLLWRRKVPTRGLLNVVAAPHLSEASTYAALRTSHPADVHATPAVPKPHAPPVAIRQFTAQVAHHGGRDTRDGTLGTRTSQQHEAGDLHHDPSHSELRVVSNWMVDRNPGALSISA